MGTTPHADEEPLRRIAARRIARWARREAGSRTFARLLVMQACGVAGDGLVALALAGSLFFSVPETTARNRVVLYLLITVAPLAMVAPLLSTVLDRHRGALRAALVVAAAGRAMAAWLLASSLGSLVVFPLAFSVLALSRASQVARNALLPAVAPPGRALVSTNSSLAKASALSGLVFVPVGWAVIQTLGAATELRLAAVVYLAGAVPALTLPATRERGADRDWRDARADTRPLGVRRTVVANAGMRFLGGFLVFHLAFSLRREDLGTVGLGLVLAAAALGTLGGAILSGRAGQRVREEVLVVSALIAAGVFAIAVGLLFSVPLAALLVFVFGIASGASKLALDALVQRDIDPAARGWVFARYETVLQLSWVLGALLPVAVALPADLGIGLVGAGSALLALLYAAGSKRTRRAEPRH